MRFDRVSVPDEVRCVALAHADAVREDDAGDLTAIPLDRGSHGRAHCTFTPRSTAAALVAFNATAMGPSSTSPFLTALTVVKSGSHVCTS